MLPQHQLKKLYNKKYVKSFEEKQSIFRLKQLINSVKFSSNFKVADFGCGNGMLFSLLSGKIYSYTGIDFSEDFIKAALEKKYSSTTRCNFICEDIVSFCSKNKNTYDLAFAMDFSEHVYDTEWVKILKAINSSLKNQGKLYLHTPNAEFFIEIMKKHNLIVKQFPEHIAVRDLNENCRLLEVAGFTITKILFFPHYNILKILHPMSFLPVLGKYFKARIFIEATAFKSSD